MGRRKQGRICGQTPDFNAKLECRFYRCLASGAGPGGMMGGFIGAYVNAANQEAIQKYNAEIDARRQPVKKDLLALFTRRARSVGDQYSVCVDGAERRYGYIFSRLAERGLSLVD